MKNQIPPPQAGRQPRSIVQINGTAIPYLEWTVNNNSYFAADTFTVTSPIAGLPQGFGVDYFLNSSQIDAEVFVGFPADPTSFGAPELMSLIYGRTDSVVVDFKARTIELTGRDLTSTMIDKKTSVKYQNLTASQIVTTIAQENGLTPVITATSVKVGRFYQNDHIRLQDDRTEWDLLTWLARESQSIVYVQGKELHFEPEPAETQDPYVFQVGSNGVVNTLSATELKVEHALTVAAGVTVNVRSWHSKQGKAFTKQAKTAKGVGKVAKGKGVGGTAQAYDYTIPGLTAEGAQAKANQLLAEISKHEIKIEVDGPADNILLRTDIIQVKGTGTVADTVYYPSSIARAFSMKDGYTWKVEAKNHSPESEPSL